MRLPGFTPELRHEWCIVGPVFFSLSSIAHNAKVLMGGRGGTAGPKQQGSRQAAPGHRARPRRERKESAVGARGRWVGERDGSSMHSPRHALAYQCRSGYFSFFVFFFFTGVIPSAFLFFLFSISLFPFLIGQGGKLCTINPILVIVRMQYFTQCQQDINVGGIGSHSFS